MIHYFHWLHQLLPTDPLRLVLDHHATHTTENLESEAHVPDNVA
jgi:hypothetical protein